MGERPCKTTWPDSDIPHIYHVQAEAKADSLTIDAAVVRHATAGRARAHVLREEKVVRVGVDGAWGGRTAWQRQRLMMKGSRTRRSVALEGATRL